MSTNSFNSVWVQNEVSFAQSNNKPIFPLLLEGPVWLSMAAMQYVDVRGEKMPPDRFFEELRSDLNQLAPPAPLPKQREQAIRKPSPPKSRQSLYIGGAIFLCVAALCALSPVAWNWLSSITSPDEPKQIKTPSVPPAVTPESVSQYGDSLFSNSEYRQYPIE